MGEGVLLGMRDLGRDRMELDFFDGVPPPPPPATAAAAALVAAAPPPPPPAAAAAEFPPPPPPLAFPFFEAVAIRSPTSSGILQFLSLPPPLLAQLSSRREGFLISRPFFHFYFLCVCV